MISQCHCFNRISTVADDIVALYYELRKTFITKLYPNFNASVDSCDANNQALVWLASADGTPSRDANLLQRYILALVFILWNGSQWMVADGWLSSTGECYWCGLSCPDSLGEITGMDLNGNNVSGNLGSEFTRLTALGAITLSLNRMKGRLPSELGNLGSLTQLSLASNQLTGTLPTEVFETFLDSQYFISTLDVSMNKLTVTIPTLVGNLSYVGTCLFR